MCVCNVYVQQCTCNIFAKRARYAVTYDCFDKKKKFFSWQKISRVNPETGSLEHDISS